VVPVCFVLSGDLVYSVIDEKPKRTTRLRRVRNIEEHGRATLVVDHYEEDWSRLGWVMLRADASILGGGDEHAGAIRRLRDRYAQYLDMTLDEAPVLRLRVTRVNEWWASGAADR
jgi:PPOX class probable F420-dependent enzyme